MAAPQRDNHLAARALADWARHRFNRAEQTAVADSYGISVRTLWRWKAALDSDSELSALYKAAVQAHVTRDWADLLDATLSAAITRMLALIEDSDDLAAVTEAFAKLSEVAIAKEMLRGALHGQQAPRSTTGDGANAGNPAAPAAFGPS